MERVKKLIKKNVSAMLFCSGMISVKNLMKKNLILGYHRVLPEDHEITHFVQPGMYVTTKTFEKHLQFLVEHFKVVHLQDLSMKEGAQNQCVITFDDGWFDNYEFALPLMAKYNIPATIFLSTRYIGTNDWPWPDKLSYIFFKGGKKIQLEILNKLARYQSPLQDEILSIAHVKPVKLAADKTIEFSKRLPWDKLQKFIAETETIADSILNQLNQLKAWLSWEDVVEMEKNNVQFASHTHNHIILNDKNYEKIDEELEKSIKILHSQVKNVPAVFSYPNGEYSEILLEKLKKMGIQKAVTTQFGYVNPSTNPLLLPRILVHNDISDSLAEFVNVLARSVIYR